MSNDLEDSELMDIFFNDAPEAKLMINGGSLRIVRANDAFLELFSKKRNEVIGQLWKDLDVPENHAKYDQYIKELNTKDSMNFILKHKIGSEYKDFKCVYQISALSGTIGYLGSIEQIKQTDISDGISKLIESVLSYQSGGASGSYHEIIEQLSLDFLGQYRIVNNQLVKQELTGDVEKLEQILSKYENNILKKVANSKSLEISRENYPTSQSIDLLLELKLKSLFAYPISFQNKLYGILIAGGKTSPENWNTIKSVLQILSHQISFNLFDMLVEKQKEIDDQYDKLTGLRNRASLNLALENLEKKGVMNEKHISLFSISIDNLKSINDKIGIKYTDEVIRSFSQLITKTIRRMGKVFRTSGEGFSILLSAHRNKDSSIKVAEKLIETLSVPTLLSNGEELDLSFNIGISIYPDEGQTIKSLSKNVDLALLDAKSKGMNNYVVFKHAETGVEIKKKTEMEQRLKKAIVEDNIQVYYQPKIKTDTEELVGFEALVRWVDNRLGIVEPVFFIPLAEETGLIHEIGKIVTTKACQKVREWQDKFGLTLSCSINLSPMQLTNPSLPQILESIINTAGVHPNQIDFEITESIGLDNVPNLVEMLSKIVEIGCTLSIDDFGTGHSSLDYIKKIPARYLKIDQSFVSNIGLNPEDEAILDATIDMAKKLKRLIIAEGVESEEQREFLLKRKVEILQGYLFAPPLKENKVDSLLEELVNLMKLN